jgi:RNA polymerase sigma factor (TIGR02999 family)
VSIVDEATGHLVTQLLHAWRQGSREAFDRLVPIVYQELRGLARRHMAGERRDHTLRTTALVNESCLRLLGAHVDWSDRAHFFAVASGVMRQVLVDHARAHRSLKRGSGQARLPLDDALDAAVERPWDLLDLDAALDRLGQQDARKQRVVELHYFGGLTFDEIADLLGIPPGAVAWDVRLAKAWLRRELRGEPGTSR